MFAYRSDIIQLKHVLGVLILIENMLRIISQLMMLQFKTTVTTSAPLCREIIVFYFISETRYKFE
ncbi:hypothetical protein BZG29_16990 [Janthinobacterium sp. LM6]|nr:hypothetical protein BZG29_16990 [Janthinobacterium sp. LM6]